MFFTAKKETTVDAYEKIKEIIHTILLQECPDHRSQHHILYTANIRLAHMEAAKEHFRALIDPSTPSGTYARSAYETTYKKYNELAALIQSYMYLCDETARKRYNHNFLFSTEKINDCYKLLKERKTYEDIIPIEDSFWTALKQEMIPVAAQICP